MSGIFGIIDPNHKIALKPLANRISQTLMHREWYVIETYVDEISNILLGRVGIGIFNRTPQPIWNASHTVALMMAGEFYKIEAVKLNKLNQQANNKSDEEIALSLYEKFTDDFVNYLNGVFIIAVLDQPRNRLTIVNDHYGLYPLFYAHYQNKFIFSPEFKVFLCEPAFPKKLNLTALDEYIRFQRLLGTKTFFENISLLPPASKICFHIKNNALTIEPYWDFSKIPKIKATFKEIVEEAGRLLRESINLRMSDSYRKGVYLSGGLDSRMILGLASQKWNPIHTVTFGDRNCSDVIYAERIAKKANSQHHYFEYTNGKWVQEYVDDHLNLTEGLHNWVNLHGIDTVIPMREHIDLQLTGFFGDQLLNTRTISGVYPAVQKWDDLAFITKLFYFLNQKFSWPGLDEVEAQFVYTEDTKSKVYGRALHSLRQELKSFEKYNPFDRLDYFEFINHAMHLTHSYVLFYRSGLEIRYPFLDYEFFDFISGLPEEFRFVPKGRLYRELINQEIPEFTMIPWSKDNRLLTNNRLLWASHALGQRMKSDINRYVAPVFPQPTTLYADYENYLRNDLKQWGERILFDKRTLDRGIFNPELLRSIWARHQYSDELHNGWEIHTIGKLAPIMTYEMMLRRFYD